MRLYPTSGLIADATEEPEPDSRTMRFADLARSARQFRPLMEWCERPSAMELTSVEVDRLMRVLLEKKLELRRRVNAIGRDVGSGLDRDSAEQAVELENAGVLKELGREAMEELGQINLALARIAAGTYGTCERCGREIRPERLRAVPYAARCIHCESELASNRES